MHMENLYKLTLDFLNSLDKEETVINLKENYNKLKSDTSLKNKIKKYQEKQDNKLLNEIEDNELYRIIKKNEAELGYIILEINNKLKEINSKGKCL